MAHKRNMRVHRDAALVGKLWGGQVWEMVQRLSGKRFIVFSQKKLLRQAKAPYRLLNVPDVDDDDFGE